ncbi:MAG TPA: response regulator, partial [Gemmatimonadales bacterium]|nr:response regulator [Gemmatimonadales bacterium]
MVRPTEVPVRARTLLVIDDEPPIRRAVANALRDVAERVVEASTGAEGTELAAAERPELVVLDLGLPDLPGVEVCREIRRWSPTPILVLTARHDESEKVLLFNSGADDYVTK